MNCLGADEFQCDSLRFSTVTKKEILNENKNQQMP
jgi:hypothetical protein